MGDSSLESQVELTEMVSIERREILRKQLTGTSRLHTDLDGEKAALKKQLEKTLIYGESTTTLVVGLSGCGKSSLVNVALDEFLAAHPHSQKPTLVRLDGSVEIDDRRSVISIASQIGVDCDLEAENLSEDEANEVTALQAELSSTKLYDAMHTVVSALKGGGKNKASVDLDRKENASRVVIIMDRFIKFALRKMQTLLYNLLDLARDGKVALALVGICAKPDVDAHLEKRVKSRFASRKTITISRCWSTDQMMQFANHILNIAGDEIWNTEIKKLLGNQFLRRQLELFTMQHNTPDKISLLFLTALHMTADDNYLASSAINEAAMLICDTGRSDESRILGDLSQLQLVTAVAVCKVSESNPGKPLNFEMVYKLILDHRLDMGYSRKIHLRSFQQCVEAGILKRVQATTSSSMFEYLKFTPMIQRSDIHECMQYLQANDVPKHIRDFAGTTIAQ